MKLRTILAAAIIAAPIAATAAPLSYTYGEASYQIWTDSDIDTHNWAFKGSYQIGDNYYFTAEDSYFSPFGKGRSGGVGLFAPIDNNLHVYGQFSLADSNDGIRPIAEVGARIALNDQLEGRLAARYINDGANTKDKDEWIFQAEGVYALNSKVDVLASVAAPLEDSGAVITAGARFNF